MSRASQAARARKGGVDSRVERGAELLVVGFISNMPFRDLDGRYKVLTVRRDSFHQSSSYISEPVAEFVLR